MSIISGQTKTCIKAIYAGITVLVSVCIIAFGLCEKPKIYRCTDGGKIIAPNGTVYYYESELPGGDGEAHIDEEFKEGENSRYTISHDGMFQCGKIDSTLIYEDVYGFSGSDEVIYLSYFNYAVKDGTVYPTPSNRQIQSLCLWGGENTYIDDEETLERFKKTYENGGNFEESLFPFSKYGRWRTVQVNYYDTVISQEFRSTAYNDDKKIVEFIDSDTFRFSGSQYTKCDPNELLSGCFIPFCDRNLRYRGESDWADNGFIYDSKDAEINFLRDADYAFYMRDGIDFPKTPQDVLPVETLVVDIAGFCQHDITDKDKIDIILNWLNSQNRGEDPETYRNKVDFYACCESLGGLVRQSYGVNIFYDSDNHKFYTVTGGKNEELPKTVASVIEEEIYDDPVWYSLYFFDA